MPLIAEYARKPWVMCVLAVAVGFAVYAQATGFDFVYDDNPLIVENELLRDFSSLNQLLTMEDAIGGYSTGYYRPIVNIIDLLIYQAFGPRPAIFHLISIFYHMAAVALLFVLASRFVSPSAAFVGSLFLALHPLNTEAVIFISGKNNVQCAVLLLASLLLYLRYMDTGEARWASFSGLVYILALLTKEFALVFPFVVLAFLFITGKWRRRDLVSFMASLVFVIAFLALRATVISGLGVEIDVSTFHIRVLNAFEVLANYMRLTIMPVGQKALYTFEPGYLPAILIGLAATASLLVIAWRKRQTEWIVLSVIWYLGFLAPVSNVFPLSGSPMAERFMYVSLMGAGLAAAGLYERYVRGRLGKLIAASLLLSLAVLTVMRGPVWKDERALYTHMTLASPDSYKGFYNLGNLYFEDGDFKEASRMWEQTLEKKPDMMAVYNNLGVAYERSGDYQRAEQFYRKLLDGHSNSTVHSNLAMVLMKQGRLEEAVKSFDAAIDTGGDSDDLYMAYSEIFESRGDPQGAVDMLLRVSEKKGGAWRLLNRAGAIEGARGRLMEAEKYFSEALRLNPECQECSFNMELIKKLKAR